MMHAMFSRHGSICGIKLVYVSCRLLWWSVRSLLRNVFVSARTQSLINTCPNSIYFCYKPFNQPTTNVVNAWSGGGGLGLCNLLSTIVQSKSLTVYSRPDGFPAFSSLRPFPQATTPQTKVENWIHRPHPHLLFFHKKTYNINTQ